MTERVTNTDKGSYRFLQLEWGPASLMSEELNRFLAANETVVSISALKDEVLVLVRLQYF